MTSEALFFISLCVGLVVLMPTAGILHYSGDDQQRQQLYSAIVFCSSLVDTRWREAVETGAAVGGKLWPAVGVVLLT